MKFENEFERDRREVRNIQRLHRLEQESGQMYEEAMKIVIDETLYEAWWNFVQAGKAYRLAEGDHDTDCLHREKPSFDAFKGRVEGLRERDPRDFLWKNEIWRMSYSDYSNRVDAMVNEVIDDFFERLGSDFFDNLHNDDE